MLVVLLIGYRKSINYGILLFVFDKLKGIKTLLSILAGTMRLVGAINRCILLSIVYVIFNILPTTIQGVLGAL